MDEDEEEDLSGACVGRHVRAREGGRGMEVGRVPYYQCGGWGVVDKCANKTR